MNKINKVGCETAKSEFGDFDQSITLLWFSSFLRVVESTPNASRYAFSALVIRSLNISHSFLHLSLTCRGITTFIFTFTVQFFSHIFKCQCEFNNINSLHTASHGALPSWGWPCMWKRWNHHRLKRLYKDLSKDKRISHTLTRMFALDKELVTWFPSEGTPWWTIHWASTTPIFSWAGCCFRPNYILYSETGGINKLIKTQERI